MVPESPSVCFRCKMCKVCFLTMNEIERHLKATNHYIRPSSNNSNSSTKEKSTAIDSSDDKPLNLSSKSSVFSPHPTPSPTSKKPATQIDLSVSSEGIEGRKLKGAVSALKDSSVVKLKEEGKPEPIPKTVVSRKASVDDLSIVRKSACLKTPAHEDIADLETDTVSSTSSEPPPPSNKILLTPTQLETREAETSTQLDEEKIEQTCSTTQECENGVAEETGDGKVMAEASKDVVHNKDACPPAQCVEKEKAVSPMFVDKKEESVSTTDQSQITTTVSEEKVVQSENGKSEESDMSPNENAEPQANGNRKKAEPTKMKAKEETPASKKSKKQRYRCKHCGDMFTFPVQVHMHMRKVHSSVTGESPSSNNNKVTRRRSSLGTPSNNNNNNNEKINVQMYPLRSLDARAKRRTRSMLSDTSGGGDFGRLSRRSSLGHSFNNNNNEVKKEKKNSTTTNNAATTRKVVTFTCRHCGKKFPLLNQLKIHLHKVHPEKVTKKGEANKLKGDAKQRHLQTSKRLVQASKTRQQQRQASVQSEGRVTRRVSTRSASRSAESEPEMAERRMSTRRSSLAKSDKSGGGLGSTPSSRRSSTRRESRGGGKSVKLEMVKVVEMEEEDEENSCTGEEKAPPPGEKLRHSSSSSSSGSNGRKKRSLSSADEAQNEEESPPEEPEKKAIKMEEAMQVDNEEDTIYNDSDCMIIDTVETILYALTSKRSQTCPNCNKYCKFAGNFKLHLKACMNLDDDLEVKIENDDGNYEKPSPVKMLEEEDPEVDEDEEETDNEMDDQMQQDEEEEEGEEKSESANEKDDDDAAVPYYQKLDYRRCWECGFVVSKFHNLSRHLKQRHNISMGTKEMHAKQAEILRLK